MDDDVLEFYLRELVHQAEYAQVAALDFNHALESPQDSGVARTFAAAQSLLAAAAMVSKILWPEAPNGKEAYGSLLPDRKAREDASRERGRVLCDRLGVDGLPGVDVLRARAVRNGFEHFDERLDRYFESGERHVVDRNVAPRASVVINGVVPRHLRLIDPDRLVISVLEDEVNAQELFNALATVAKAAQTELDSIDQRRHAGE